MASTSSCPQLSLVWMITSLHAAALSSPALGFELSPHHSIQPMFAALAIRSDVLRKDLNASAGLASSCAQLTLDVGGLGVRLLGRPSKQC